MGKVYERNIFSEIAESENRRYRAYIFIFNSVADIACIQAFQERFMACMR